MDLNNQRWSLGLRLAASLLLLRCHTSRRTKDYCNARQQWLLGNLLAQLTQGESVMLCDREELKRRLLNGESLEVSTDGGQYEMWVERYANPPAEYYEGHMFPIGELDTVIGALLADITGEEVHCRWLEPHGVQVQSCEEAYRKRAAQLTQGEM